jgi:hypothetical protein
MLSLAVLVGISINNNVEADKNSKGGGNKTAPQPDVQLALQHESYYFRSGVEGDCLGEDDDLEWQAIGTLAPGESFSFTPRYPGCKTHAAAITVVASWDEGTLDLTSVVPDADYASLDAEQAGQTIDATITSNRGQLCMFPTFSADDMNYTVTLYNSSNEPVTGIKLHGRHENDWAMFFYPRCLNADADGDGWNDSLEHSMANLLYPIGYINQVLQPDILWGSNYLRAAPNTPFADDEVDSFPPDLDDDGAVTVFDSAILEGHLGEGNGIPLSQISPNPGEYWYWENALAFRRYDLDGDGWVTEGDLVILEAYLGNDLPVHDDPVAPTARITSHQNGAIVARGGATRLTAHAWDNKALSRVDYLVNGKQICSKTDPIPGFGFESPLFSCWWDVPKRARDYTIEILAHDVDGNIGMSDVVIVKAQ